MTAPSEAEIAPRSSGWLIARLSAMMFLQYWPLGLWAITVSTFIATNTGDDAIFSAGFLGLSSSASAIGSLVAPTFFGWVADRHFAAEKLLAALHVGAAGALWWMHGADSQTPFFLGMLLYYQCYGPTSSLTNTVAMRSLSDSHHEFPAVRLYGTVAWIVAGVFVGVVCRWWWGASIESTRIPLMLGAISHLGMSLYSLTLPHSPTEPRRTLSGAPRARLMHNKPFMLFLFVSLLASIPSKPYDFANAFLNQKGYSGAAATLTFGQFTEVACLAAMPFFGRRYRLKSLFLIGVLGWALRYVLLAAGSLGGPDTAAVWPVFGAIFLHGPSYVFVYLAGQMYVDRLVDKSHRGVAQGLHALATMGVGHLTGSFLTAYSQATFLTPTGVTPPPYNWVAFWLAPVSFSLLVAVLFTLSFSDRPRTPAVASEATPV